MKIKTKLTINVLVVVLVIAAVSVTSIIGMGSVKQKLVYLTERSTPFQIRTLEFQKAVQTVTADLARTSGANRTADYRSYRGETEKSLAEVTKAEAVQAALKGTSKEETTGELKQIATELFTITEGRLKAEEEAAAASETVSAKIRDAASRLKDLDRKVRGLQQQRSAAYAKSVEELKATTRRMTNIQSVKEALKDLQMGSLEVQRADNSKRIIIGRGKANSSLDKIAKSDYGKESKTLPADLKELRDRIDELAKVQGALLKQEAGDAKARHDALVLGINEKLTSLALAIENDDFAAEDKYAAETVRQGELLLQVAAANEILLGGSELNSLGSSVDGLAARLFMVQSPAEVDAIDASLKGIFGQIDSVGKKLQAVMTKSNAKAELGILRNVQSELTAIRGLLLGSDGIAVRIRQQLTMRAKALQANEKMRGIVLNQVEKGKVTVDAARGEQEKAIISANTTVSFSTTLIVIISVAAILFGIAFGIWIYRSIANPMGQLLLLSGAIAKGDLTMNLEVKTQDEVGEVATSLNSMVTGLKEMIGKIKESSGQVASVADEIAAGSAQLTSAANSQASAAEETSSTMVQMAASIQSVAGNTDNLASNVAEVSSAVMELGASSEEVAKSAEVMASSVAETSATIEQMTVSIDRVAQNSEELASSVTETSSTVEQMTVSIDQVAGNSQNLQAIVTATAATIGQLAESINQVAKNVSEADSVAKTAAQEGMAGQDAIESALAAMKRVAEVSDKTAASIISLGHRSEEIGNIVSLINEIADQTNLLALNAAIEAARAGDAGRGFAVVAEEVRKLAERSVAATREIALVISQVQSETSQSVKYGELASSEAQASMALSAAAGNALTNIVKSVEQTSGLMSAIAAMTAEQATSSSQVIKAVEQMNQATAQVATAAREQSMGSRQIRISIERMNGITQEVTGATREQAQGSRQIRQAVENMNQVTQQVTIATREQALSAKQIVVSVNSMNSMTQSVANATAEQKMGGAQVVTAVENISDLARTNLEAMAQLAGSAGNLSRQAVDLAGLVAQFKVE